MIDNTLPNGWNTATLDDLIVKISNGANVAQYDVEVGLPISRIETIWNGKIDLKRVKYIRECDQEFISKYKLQKGDILFSHINSDSHLGKTAIYKDQAECLIHGCNLLLIRLSPEICSDFINYQFQFLKLKGAFIDVAQRAVNQSSINQQKLKQFEFLIPPINEQKRIVVKIEELFSELDNGIKSLKTAREQLKVYRQAILKYAFEGKLTAAWREQNKDKLESASQLLERIRQEREDLYQQQIIDWEAAIKVGKKPNKPKAPQPIAILTTEEHEKLPKLPNGWLWVRYGNLCSIVRNGISQKPEGNEGTKIFRISAVRPMEFIINDIRYIDNSNGQYDEYFLQKGDLVFTRYNGSRHYVGVCAEYKFNGNHLFPDKLIQTRVSIPSIINGYLEKAINCEATRKFIERLIRTTAGQSGISGSDIKAMPVPICSIAEQEIINNYISEELSRIAKIENEIEINLQKSEALRQSILKKAFSGSLVAQDANDEPANVLLERIRTEKKFHLADNKTKHEKDVKSDNKFTEDYLTKEAAV